jgi:alkanesulfonate monooxygenase SsuD/methylene tetrahydromethanopterin reductase-like flavin-dependent oxidoreductase (luciferase family)
VRIAEDAAVLDILSDGRVILGVGAGFAEEEFRAYGVDRAARDTIFQEAMEVIVNAWTKTNFSFSGRHFRVPLQDFPVFAVTPKPVQAPHPPVWVGAFSRSTIERAARWGFPYVAAATETLGALQRKAGWYSEALAAAGRKPLAVEMPVIREVFVAETEAEARAAAAEPLLRFYRRYARAGVVRDDAGRRLGPEELTWERLGDRFLVGTPATCLERILEYERAAGMTYLLCRMNTPGIPQAAVLRSMQLFMSEVAPHLAGPAPWTPTKASV